MPGPYTSELIDLSNVLGLLVELEPKQNELLQQVIAGSLIEWQALDQSLGNSKVGKRQLATGELIESADATLF